MVTTVLHMVPNDRRRDSLREASRVLCWGGRLVLIDYAGDLSGRSHLSARHGRHGQFDLNGLWGMLVEEGFTAVEGTARLAQPALPAGDEDLI